MCMDYCLLNAKARCDAYPLPRIDESLDLLTYLLTYLLTAHHACVAHRAALDVLGGTKYFSTMDLASTYNQVEVSVRLCPFL